jgi:putative membrane protein
VLVVVALAAYFRVLEMFLWRTPVGLKTFRMSPDKAETTAQLAMNQGLYNGFLAAGLVWGLVREDRGALTFFKACQALAMVGGRDFVIPEDVKRLAGPVLSHRIVMRDRRMSRGDFSPEARFIQKVVSEIAVPR